jgi:hypothetical protein
MRPHKYYVPEAEAVKTYGVREVCQGNAAGKREYEARRYKMEVRQGFRCAKCERTAGSAMEFDHQNGRGSGGGRRDDRIEVDGKWFNAALCHMCNAEKGSKRYQWLQGRYVPRPKVEVDPSEPEPTSDAPPIRYKDFVSREVKQREVA